MVRNVSVIGAGTMGNGIAHVFAQNGFKVTLIDISLHQLNKALETIEKNCDRQVAKALITQEQKKALMKNITIESDLEEGVRNADLILEAATEDEEIKLNIFKEVDKAAPQHAILASNTSSISITKMASATHRDGNVIGMHFMNPVPVMKLVEVINGYATKKEVTESVMEL